MPTFVANAVLALLQVPFLTEAIPRPEDLPMDSSLTFKVRQGRQFRQWSNFATNSSNTSIINIFIIPNFTNPPRPAWTLLWSDESCRLYSTMEIVRYTFSYISARIWKFRFEALHKASAARLIEAFTKGGTIYHSASVTREKFTDEWSSAFLEGIQASKTQLDSLTLSVAPSVNFNDSSLLKLIHENRIRRKLNFYAPPGFRVSDAFFQRLDVQLLYEINFFKLEHNDINDDTFRQLRAFHLKLGPTPELTETAVRLWLDPSLIPPETYKTLEIQPAFQVNVSTWLRDYRSVMQQGRGSENCTIYLPSNVTVFLGHGFTERAHFFEIRRYS